MPSKLIAPLVGATLLVAVLGGLWISGILGPEPGRVPVAEPGPGSASTQPRALAPVNLRITVEGAAAPFQISVGDELQLRAEVELEDGSVRWDAPIAWSSTDPQIAAFGTAGILRGLSTGEVMVRADLSPLTAKVRVQIAE